MAIIPQQTLFVWSEIEELGDLERLRMVIENMPDEELMEVLERERGKKRKRRLSCKSGVEYCFSWCGVSTPDDRKS